MDRVMVLGPPGSGKSTLARGLADATGLPVIHLDAVFWQPGWVEPDKAVFTRQVAEIAQGERWIIDGVYASRSFDLRLERADTILLLDLPRRVYLGAVVKRCLTGIGRSRPDMAPECPERLDREFLRYVWEYEAKRMGALRAALAGYQHKVVRFARRREARAYLARARQKAGA